MKIESLHIKNFKSIIDVEIIEPNNFTVFVGPNGAGKSNIFEALEFFVYVNRYQDSAIGLFDGYENIHNRNSEFDILSISLTLDQEYTVTFTKFKDEPNQVGKKGTKLQLPHSTFFISKEVEDIIKNQVSRIFVKNTEKQKINDLSSEKVNFSTSNLEKVLKRILRDPIKKEEISDWLQLLIPEFENVEIDAADRLKIKEKSHGKPFEKDLISDGTYNILALLTAVYQSDEPQFLCIEEPENGLHPQVIREMVKLFRAACEQKGHYIWLNTHSQTLASELTQDEIVVVNKIKGETEIKQFKSKYFGDLRMDEAWLSNALEGGLIW